PLIKIFPALRAGGIFGFFGFLVIFVRGGWPMALTREEVLHVAELARLSLSPEEIELFTGQLNDILEYVEKLQELDTSGVAPLAHVIPLGNVFREDQVR